MIEFVLVMIINGGEPKPLFDMIVFDSHEACMEEYRYNNLDMFERLGTKFSCEPKKEIE